MHECTSCLVGARSVLGRISASATTMTCWVDVTDRTISHICIQVRATCYANWVGLSESAIEGGVRAISHQVSVRPLIHDSKLPDKREWVGCRSIGTQMLTKREVAVGVGDVALRISELRRAAY